MITSDTFEMGAWSGPLSNHSMLNQPAPRDLERQPHRNTSRSPIVPDKFGNRPETHLKHQAPDVHNPVEPDKVRSYRRQCGAGLVALVSETLIDLLTRLGRAAPEHSQQTNILLNPSQSGADATHTSATNVRSLAAQKGRKLSLSSKGVPCLDYVLNVHGPLLPRRYARGQRVQRSAGAATICTAAVPPFENNG